jgi:DNA replication and repair protein RecF
MIHDLRLQNFRSYSDSTFEFGNGVNIVVGPNASGKTNLLEAILVLARGNSYRTSNLRELIRFKKDWARLEANTGGEKRIIKLDNRQEPVTRTFTINAQDYRRLPLSKSMAVVLFEPEHLRLLSGQPERRRDYLDDTLEQIITGYRKLRRDYRRALAQRNSLLKQGQANQNQLFAWNMRLSELGGQIANARYGLARQFNDELAVTYRKLSGSKTSVELGYSAPWSAKTYASQLLKKLESNTELDYLRGFTAYGPHRDDFVVLLGGHLAQETASRGELRTLLLAIKIIELKILEDVRGQKPLLLLDDVFSELDGRRRRFLTKFLKDYQTFITTTDADIVVQHFMDKCTIIPTST